VVTSSVGKAIPSRGTGGWREAPAEKEKEKEKGTADLYRAIHLRLASPLATG
jgi:hypothetical protein